MEGTHLYLETYARVEALLVYGERFEGDIRYSKALVCVLLKASPNSATRAGRKRNAECNGNCATSQAKLKGFTIFLPLFPPNLPPFLVCAVSATKM